MNLDDCGTDLLKAKIDEVCTVLFAIEQNFRQHHSDYDASMAGFIVCSAMLHSASRLNRDKHAYLLMAGGIWDGYYEFDPAPAPPPNLTVVKK